MEYLINLIVHHVILQIALHVLILLMPHWMTVYSNIKIKHALIVHNANKILLVHHIVVQMMLTILLYVVHKYVVKAML